MCHMARCFTNMSRAPWHNANCCGLSSHELRTQYQKTGQKSSMVHHEYLIFMLKLKNKSQRILEFLTTALKEQVVQPYATEIC